MSTELLLAPVSAGKTTTALNILSQIVRERAFAPVWVLLSGNRQEDAFRQRLAEQSGRSVHFNISFFSFYNLYAHLLDIAGRPQRRLDQIARLRLLRLLLSDLQNTGQLKVFHKIADKPGFAKVIADFIYELKQNVIYPETFKEVASSDKDHDLAAIYTAYQQMLQQNDLVDRDGEGWLALSALRDDPEKIPGLALLLVDGYDQFTRLQAQLIALLASRAERTLVTLPTVAGREQTIGRRFSEAVAQLNEAHERLGQPLKIAHLQAAVHVSKPSALLRLAEDSFPLEVQAHSSEGCLYWIEAPDLVQEAAAVMRRVKRLLLTTNCRPDDVLVAVRDWDRYGRHLANAARQYSVPIELHYSDSLANNPLIIALNQLVMLHQNDFRRHDLLDVLRSPYFDIPGFGRVETDLLERISRVLVVTGGRDAWIEAVSLAAMPQPLEEEAEVVTPVLSTDQAEVLIERLTAFFNTATPPDNATMDAYVEWLENLIGDDTESDPDEESAPHITPGFSILSQVRQTAEREGVAERDLKALKGFKRVLQGLLTTQQLARALGLERKGNIERAVFVRELQIAVGATLIEGRTDRSGKVLVTTVADARGLPHKHVFIPGLSEGIFPAPIPEDPLYLDSERLALRHAGVRLETQSERAADEGLFYELINAAQESLTLSRPTVINGALWPESHLWRAVKILYSDSQTLIEQNRIHLGDVVGPDEVSTRAEASLAVANALNRGELSGDVYNWLVVAEQGYWGHVLHARQVEYRRMTSRMRDAYSGRLTSPRLLDWIANELGPEHIWSASQFNDYGVCGFRFFAKRLLKLEKIEEPEPGLTSQQLGTLNHAILEKTYLHLGDVTIAPPYAEQAVNVLREVANKILHEAPRRYGFRASALWEQEKVALLRRLETLIRLDFAESNPLANLLVAFPRRPYRQEVPFSPDGNHSILLPLDNTIGGLQVTGYIDRLDRVGEQVLVIDYKTGSTRIPLREMERGRNFQMMLYLLAGQYILDHDPDPDAPDTVAGGLFWHLRDNKTSGQIMVDSDEGRAAMQQARQHLSRNIREGRQGNFAVEPNRRGRGPCAHYCEFHHLCRESVMNPSMDSNA
jgi:ATP-dependent helicase/nuclease subunit B